MDFVSNMSNQIQLSDYVASFLAKHTSHAFVGQGSSVVHLLNSIDKRNDIHNIPSQNEQAASLAADAYSRVSGHMGVSIATSGPGLLNLLQGMGCSYFDSIPSLFISGAVVTSQLRNNSKIRQVGFQEMEVVDIVKPLSKYAVLIKDKNKIRYELEKAIYYAKEGRPGPAVIDLPDDLQRDFIDPEKLEGFVPPKLEKNINDEDFNKLLKLIVEAKAPIIIYGNGIKVAKAENDLDIFLKKTNIPFAPTWATVDLYDDQEKNLVGIFGVAASRYGNFAIQSSDLLVCLGTRLNTQLTGSRLETFAPNAKKIIVDIDEAEFIKDNGLKIDIAFNTCVKSFLKKINNSQLITDNNVLGKWSNWISDIKKKFPTCKQEYYDEIEHVNPYVFFETLSKVCTNDDIIMPDTSANLIWAYQSFKPKKGQQIFTALNHSPMGYSVAAAIGAYYASASKNKRVIATIGDGSFAMNVQELETISHNNIPIKIFIINNEGYALIKGTQELFLEKNYVGVDKNSGLGIPDFKKIAYSYDIKYVAISNHTDLDNKLEEILNCEVPIIVDVIVNPDQRVNPKLEFGKPIHDLSPTLSKEELNNNIYKY